MSLSSLFDTFSRRKQEPHRDSEHITHEFRQRVILLCIETASSFGGFGPSSEHFWSEIYRKIIYLYGRTISTSGVAASPKDDIIKFLTECETENFLDFVELFVKSKPISDSGKRWSAIVDNINTFFQVDELPYFLTGFIFQSQSSYGIVETYPVESYPRVIRRDSTVLHNTAIEQSLSLLENPMFSSANSEFLEALGHYRKCEYADCLSKCGSSLESVMKIICHRKKWPYNQSDTAGPLLEAIVRESGLEGFFREPLILVGTIRNRLSSAHGAGTQQRAVPKHKAAFAINATASAILLLVEETNP